MNKIISLNQAKKEFYNYYALHESLARIKKTHVKFSKELVELLVIRDQMDSLFERYEKDSKSSEDFVELMNKYIKYLHKIDAFKVDKINHKNVRLQI